MSLAESSERSGGQSSEAILDLSSLKEYELGENMQTYLAQVGFLDPREVTRRGQPRRAGEADAPASGDTPGESTRQSGIREMIEQMQAYACEAD